MNRIVFALALIAAPAAFAQSAPLTRAVYHETVVARFAAADASRDGAIDDSEVRAAFTDADKMKSLVDADGDGVLQETEWRTYSDDLTAMIFMFCDANQDGALTDEEHRCGE